MIPSPAAQYRLAKATLMLIPACPSIPSIVSKVSLGATRLGKTKKVPSWPQVKTFGYRSLDKAVAGRCRKPNYLKRLGIEAITAAEILSHLRLTFGEDC
jgi:hypothetical protein